MWGVHPSQASLPVLVTEDVKPHALEEPYRRAVSPVDHEIEVL
jgi:hypothetical protein